MNNNPLLEPFETPFQTPPFDKIANEHYLEAIKAAVAQGLEEVEQICQNPEAPSFQNTIEALERSGELLGRISSIFFNLNSANTNPEMQALAQEISPLLTKYRNDIMLNKTLFERVRTVHGLQPSLETAEQQTLLENTYKSFVRNGANLSEDKKNRLREIDEEKARLSLKFGENVLAETNRYLMLITDEEELAGLPRDVIEAARETAEAKGHNEAWAFTLQYPSYLPFMTYAQNRGRREELYRAFSSKSSKGDEYDNQEIVKKIVSLRQERARLLGFSNHAEFVLAERMAESPEKVKNFLEEILQYARPAANAELEELTAYAKKLEGISTLERWDYAYYTEKLKKERFSFDDEMLRPYFSLEQVIEGVFQVANKLFGLRFEARPDIPQYAEDVMTYEVLDAQNRHLAVFYADFFPREGKRNGAWMTYFRGQRGTERPQVSIVCNFTKPSKNKPSLLTFNEVSTLFHEFGHALHCMLADTQYESLSGVNVYWDFVELPSQLLENWTYEQEALDLFARHYESKEAIPSELIARIRESAKFMEGYQTLRQLSFGLLDMAWHTCEQIPEDVFAFEQEAMAATELFPKVEGSNMSCAFSHIFQGGYSAGYYSYKWAEVLDADTFEVFKSEGIFNRETANRFREHILSKGGSEHPMILYKRFRGNEPKPEALLKRAGLLAN